MRCPLPVTLHKVFDASIPPDVAPPGADGVLGYVGRPGRTPHVWTPGEWRRFEHLRQFPAWLPDLGADPLADAIAAVDAVQALGWARMPEPDTRLILLDGEAAQFPAWYAGWEAHVHALGYYPVDYGSLFYVGANFARDVWAADWNDVAQLPPGESIGGEQYRANVAWRGTSIDLSVITAGLFARGGIGPRRG